MAHSKIEWTESTWNPVTGCTKISAGCDNCYAERFSERWRGTPGHPFEHGFDLMIRPERLLQPFTWKRPRMIFVNSMSDLFHKDVPKTFVAKVFDTMEQAESYAEKLNESCYSPNVQYAAKEMEPELNQGSGFSIRM